MKPREVVGTESCGLARALRGLAALWLAAQAGGPAFAEPYLALRTGHRCSTCHLNRTGGGGRTAFGSGYGRQQLPPPDAAGGSTLLDGALTEHVRIGADLRDNYQVSFRKDAPNLVALSAPRAQLYGFVDVIPDRLSLYADERVAPGAAVNREAFLLLRSSRAGAYFKGGRLFLPYGWRLQDDEAATRKYTGFNFDTADTGFELGAEPGSWSLALAVTNGAAGGGETNNGKQWTFSQSFVHPRWRAGLSSTDNDLPGDARHRSAGLFGGFRAGPVVVLGEWDHLRDEPGGGAACREGEAAHLEADWTATPGLTFRAWAGRYDPDRDTDGDRLEQSGLGVDWTALPGLQVRALYRHRDGPTSISGSRDAQALLELHLYF